MAKRKTKDRKDITNDDFRVSALNAELHSINLEAEDKFFSIITKHGTATVGVEFDIRNKKIICSYPINALGYPKKLTFTVTQFMRLLISSDRNRLANKELIESSGATNEFIEAFEEEMLVDGKPTEQPKNAGSVRETSSKNIRKPRKPRSKKGKKGKTTRGK